MTHSFIQKNWFIILIFSALIFYFPIFKYGFSQDDFTHIYSSRPNSFIGFLNFFNPYFQFPDIFFFRPLATQVYFFINLLLFKLNSFPFHLEALIIHIINSFLFYKVVKIAWKKDLIALISSFLYVISATHFLSLFYISSFQQLFRMFFILSTILLYFKYTDSQKKSYLIFSLLTFLGALLSKETSIVLPLLLIPLELLRKETKITFDDIKKLFLSLSSFIIVTVIYLLIRSAGFQSIFNEGAYSYSLSLGNIFQNLKWYLIWTSGLPEILSSYPSLKPTSLLQFTRDYSLGIPLLITSVILLFSVLIFLKNFKKISSQKWILSLLIFLISLLPVLPLLGHKYPQYLDSSLLGIFPILSVLIISTNKYLKIIFIITFIILQILSLNLTEQIHWTTHRSEVSDYYYQQLQQKITLQTDTIIFIGSPTQLREVSIALAKHYAIVDWFPQIKRVQYLEVLPSSLEDGTIFQELIFY